MYIFCQSVDVHFEKKNQFGAPSLVLAGSNKPSVSKLCNQVTSGYTLSMMNGRTTNERTVIAY
jgi:hypothetical protein